MSKTALKLHAGGRETQAFLHIQGEKPDRESGDVGAACSDGVNADRLKPDRLRWGGKK